MKKSHYVESISDISGKVFFKCSKCDYDCYNKYEILGHIASEHLSQHIKKAITYCDICSKSVSMCIKIGTCVRAKQKRQKDNKVLDNNTVVP